MGGSCCFAPVSNESRAHISWLCVYHLAQLCSEFGPHGACSAVFCMRLGDPNILSGSCSFAPVLIEICAPISTVASRLSSRAVVSILLTACCVLQYFRMRLGDPNMLSVFDSGTDSL